jgi:hypothetical protein
VSIKVILTILEGAEPVGRRGAAKMESRPAARLLSAQAAPR